MPDMRTNLTPDERIGWAIRSAREYRGLSINELASRLDWHRNTLSAIEKGERHARNVELRGIAAELNWPVAWLRSPGLPELDGPDGDDTGGTTGRVNVHFRHTLPRASTAQLPPPQHDRTAA
jgi:transcriptional regulator with XRE-family HTH domain